jgi:hypothetical protein
MGFGAGFAGGLVVSLIVIGSAMVGGMQYFSKKAGRDAQRGWNLVPVLVTTRPVAAGEALVPTDYKEGSTPEQFAPGSFPPVDAPALRGKKLEAPLVAGEVITRGHFEKRPWGRRCVAAAQETAVGARLAEDPAVKRTLETLDRAADAQLDFQ